MSGLLKVLFVEDSEDDAAILLLELKRGGYECTSHRVHDEESLRTALTSEDWDVVICDYRLPQFDGLEALKLIRSLVEAPVLIVSGTIGEETAVEALKGGADDYLLKDRLTRLSSAVKGALREAALRKLKRAADTALQESEERYRRLVESSPDAMLILSDDKLVYINPAGVRLLGVSTPMDLLGKGVADLFRCEQLPALAGNLRQSAECNELTPIEVQVVRPDGTTRIVELLARSIVYHSDESLQVTCRDISLRRQLERELQQSQRMEAVARLAGGVAHDFNNLLTVLLGHMGLVKSSLRPDDPVYSDVQHASIVAERAFHLTHQLLALSRKQTLSRLPLNLNAIIAQTQGLLARSLREEIQLQLRLAPDLRLTRLDPGQFEHVLLNLAAQARASMPQGGRLTIETANASITGRDSKRSSDLPPGEYVFISVADTGAGFADEAQQQIFEPFITAGGSAGPGLGLATVYGIVRQHEGWIYCHSAVGRGSRFEIYLPVYVEPTEPLAPFKLTGDPAVPKTVLVVEDEEILLEFAQLVLHKHGYQVLTARDGREALQICQCEGHRIDLVFTDVVMPSMSGPEFSRELPKFRPELPIVFTSGYTEPVLVENGLNLRGQKFLAKPYTMQALLAKIEEALRDYAQQSSSTPPA